MNNAPCPLCHSKTTPFYEDSYSQCTQCLGVIKTTLPTQEEEKERYLSHNNDVDDKRYQKFVATITDPILKEFSPHHIGLDFGAGTGPVISKILRDHGLKIFEYDPFFTNKQELLEKEYDYIACCEVIEHFHNPRKEFALLKDLLKPGGKLFCKTHPYNSGINFEKWYYKEDPTHVFFYQIETFSWIEDFFGFKEVKVEERRITFKK